MLTSFMGRLRTAYANGVVQSSRSDRIPRGHSHFYFVLGQPEGRAANPPRPPSTHLQYDPTTPRPRAVSCKSQALTPATHSVCVPPNCQVPNVRVPISVPKGNRQVLPLL